MAVTIAVGAQTVVVKTIKETDPKFIRENLLFPLIVIPTNKEAEKTINDDLRNDFLHVEPWGVHKSIFENIEPDSDGTNATVSDIDYEVICNKNGILSLSITGEGCGAYCEVYTHYYTYDTRSGNKITPDLLFKLEYKHIILDSLLEEKKSILRDEIAALNDTMKQHVSWKSAEDSAYYADMLQLYSDCLNLQCSAGFTYQFYLTKKVLYFELDRCSPHYNRNIDELGEFKFTYEVGKWKKYFTNYGLQLIK